MGARVRDRSAQAIPRDGLARSILRDELKKTLEWAGMDPRHALDDDDEWRAEVEVDAALWDACATAAAKDGACGRAGLACAVGRRRDRISAGQMVRGQAKLPIIGKGESDK